MGLVKSFIAKENESRPLEELSPQELDLYLSRFILAVRKKNGEEYEPTTLRGFIASVERYLKKCQYSESVITGQNFTRTREVLKSKQKQLKRLGKGNKPQAASSLTPEEIDILYEKKEMGISSAKALINTLWFNNCLHFGLRGGKEQRDLKWGDIVLKVDSAGKQYLEYSTERQTKTRPGDNPTNTRPVKPRMYENQTVPSERNPVFLYEDTLVDDTPFYLSINHVSNEKLALPETKWFKPQPMRDCALAAGTGVNKRITNHSARKTLVQTLQDHNVRPTQIVQVTGHKNLQSVNNYSTLGDRQQETISSILSSTRTPNAAQPFVQHQISESSTTALATPETRSQKPSAPECLIPSALFHGNHITGGTFNFHVSTASSLASSTMITESPKRKKFRRLRVLDSDSSQSGNSQE